MIRFLLVLILLVAIGLAVVWYSSQSLPDWYQQDQSQQQQVVEKLTNQITRQGVGGFLGEKFASVLNGKLILSEVEFNALLLSSLKSSKDGRRLLAVSDAVHAQIRNDEVEFGAVIDLEKVSKLDKRSKKAVEQLSNALPLLDKSKIFFSVTGTPIAKSGNVAFSKDFSVKVGAMPISSAFLSQLGIPVDKVSAVSLPLKTMSIQSIKLTEEKVTLGVLPRF